VVRVHSYHHFLILASGSVELAQAEVPKPLFLARRCLVDLDLLFFEPETWSQFCHKHRGIVLHYAQSTAARQTAGGEGGDNDVPTGNQCAFQHRNVALPVFSRRQKMKHGAIMPQAEGVRGTEPGDVGLVPLDFDGVRAVAEMSSTASRR